MDNEFQRGQMAAQLEMLLVKVTRLEEAIDPLRSLPARMAALDAIVQRLEAPVAQLSTARAQVLAIWAAFATIGTLVVTIGQPLLTWLRGK
jgi:hypothetical protein